jgi:general secretion pathway protein D
MIQSDRISHRWSISISTGSLLLASVTLLGCGQQSTTSQGFDVESPRVTLGGVILEEDETARDDALSQIASALDSIPEPSINPGILSSMRDRLEYESLNTESTTDRAQELIIGEVGEAEAAVRLSIPQNAGRLIQLERMSKAEINELIASITLKIQTEQGYQAAMPVVEAQLGSRPEGVSKGPTLARTLDDGTRSLIRFGYVSYLSQLPQLWVQGVLIAADGTITPNPIVDQIQEQVTGSLNQLQQMRAGLAQKNLSRQIIKLSYINTADAMKSLKGLGVQTVGGIESLPPTLNFDQLPMVAIMPEPPEASMALVGEQGASTGAFGQTSTPTKASKLNNSVLMNPTSEIMVVYHPAHPEQFSLVEQLLTEYIDRPAKQVFVEGMVLEISEEGLDELGVEWSYQQGAVDFVLGSLNATGLTDTLGLTSIDSRDLPRDWSVEIRALVRDGKAEVLSRPSILTLDNRQATIRVGEDIPIATSQEGFSGNSNKVSFNFKYLATGILLNIRPRIAEDGEVVSMLIDTVVSAQVPGRDLEIRSTDGDLLASAPTVSTRRVQTYARIDNETPLIIGGLVSKDFSITQDKVPLLGDLPFIGHAFRSERQSTEKTEVIIVLTPYVLDDTQLIRRNLPKDDDLFDSTGNQLFRDAYRIRGEDVFDLRFLAENKRLRTYRDLARVLIRNNYEFGRVPPFSEFVDDTIPGEEILVQRMVYELIKRTGVDARINPERIIYFEEKDYEGYNVRFLDSMLAKIGDGQTPESFFKLNPGKAVAITYTYSRESVEQQDLASEPIPEVALVDCPDRDTWQQLLWDLNQPNSDGIDRFTILIQDPRDIVRLQRAIMLKMIVELNGGKESLSLKNFTIGKILHTPEPGDDTVTVVDADVARYFFHTELYYSAIIKRIEETIERFDEVLDTPDVQMYLDPGMGRADLE